MQDAVRLSGSTCPGTPYAESSSAVADWRQSIANRSRDGYGSAAGGSRKCGSRTLQPESRSGVSQSVHIYMANAAAPQDGDTARY
jgi:hypothetical protein